MFKIFNIIRHLKFIQVWNRIVRKFLSCGERAGLETGDVLPEFTFLNHTVRPKGCDKTGQTYFIILRMNDRSPITQSKKGAVVIS